jgi:hypothetical protein
MIPVSVQKTFVFASLAFCRVQFNATGVVSLSSLLMIMSLFLRLLSIRCLYSS